MSFHRRLSRDDQNKQSETSPHQRVRDSTDREQAPRQRSMFVHSGGASKVTGSHPDPNQSQLKPASAENASFRKSAEDKLHAEVSPDFGIIKELLARVEKSVLCRIKQDATTSRLEAKTANFMKGSIHHEKFPQLKLEQTTAVQRAKEEDQDARIQLDRAKSALESYFIEQGGAILDCLQPGGNTQSSPKTQEDVSEAGRLKELQIFIQEQRKINSEKNEEMADLRNVTKILSDKSRAQATKADERVAWLTQQLENLTRSLESLKDDVLNMTMQNLHSRLHDMEALQTHNSSNTNNRISQLQSEIAGVKQSQANLTPLAKISEIESEITNIKKLNGSTALLCRISQLENELTAVKQTQGTMNFHGSKLVKLETDVESLKQTPVAAAFPADFEIELARKIDAKIGPALRQNTAMINNTLSGVSAVTFAHENLRARVDNLRTRDLVQAMLDELINTRYPKLAELIPSHNQRLAQLETRLTNLTCQFGFQFNQLSTKISEMKQLDDNPGASVDSPTEISKSLRSDIDLLTKDYARVKNDVDDLVRQYNTLSEGFAVDRQDIDNQLKLRLGRLPIISDLENHKTEIEKNIKTSLEDYRTHLNVYTKQSDFEAHKEYVRNLAETLDEIKDHIAEIDEKLVARYCQNDRFDKEPNLKTPKGQLSLEDRVTRTCSPASSHEKALPPAAKKQRITSSNSGLQEQKHSSTIPKRKRHKTLPFTGNNRDYNLSNGNIHLAKKLRSNPDDDGDRSTSHDKNSGETSRSPLLV